MRNIACMYFWLHKWLFAAFCGAAMQVCQADHNVVFTALGEEQTDYGERDAEDGRARYVCNLGSASAS